MLEFRLPLYIPCKILYSAPYTLYKTNQTSFDGNTTLIYTSLPIKSSMKTVGNFSRENILLKTIKVNILINNSWSTFGTRKSSRSRYLSNTAAVTLVFSLCTTYNNECTYFHVGDLPLRNFFVKSLTWMCLVQSFMENVFHIDHGIERDFLVYDFYSS